MSSGLHFVEDYVDEIGSDCIRMLFGEGKEDVAAYADAGGRFIVPVPEPKIL